MIIRNNETNINKVSLLINNKIHNKINNKIYNLRDYNFDFSNYINKYSLLRIITIRKCINSSKILYLNFVSFKRDISSFILLLFIERLS